MPPVMFAVGTVGEDTGRCQVTPDLGLELHRLVQFPEEEKASGGNWRREQGGVQKTQATERD